MKFNITDKIGYWIDAAIEEHGQGENILWEGIVMPGPDQQPLYTIFVWFPGALLGSTLNASVQLSDVLNLDKPGVDEMMADFLHQLREARSRILAQQDAAATQAPPRGSQTPSGLLIP